MYEQLRKEENGKTTHHKSEIKRHKSALAIADTCQVLELTKEEWKLELQGNQDVFYIVQLLQSSCTCKWNKLYWKLFHLKKQLRMLVWSDMYMSLGIKELWNVDYITLPYKYNQAY